ncbi:MAG: hypothetical protein KID00_12445 [Clostridium argentinense]|nr:hypothetical protein [Clostridium argentinense]
MLKENLKAKKVYNFGLINSYYGIATMEKIMEMCRECDTDIYNLELASLRDITDYVCMGQDPFEGYVEVEEGIFKWIDLSFLDDLDFCGYTKIS